MFRDAMFNRKMPGIPDSIIFVEMYSSDVSRREDVAEGIRPRCVRKRLIKDKNNFVQHIAIEHVEYDSTDVLLQLSESNDWHIHRGIAINVYAPPCVLYKVIRFAKISGIHSFLFFVAKHPNITHWMACCLLVTKAHSGAIREKRIIARAISTNKKLFVGFRIFAKLFCVLG